MIKEVKVFKNNPDLTGMAKLIPNVVFSNASGVELKMQIIVPWSKDSDGSAKQKWPLIVFLQGSAWTFPDVNYQLPQLATIARKGYVVATITHRNYLEGHPAPAFLQDAKTAIRFLRKNAEEYHIDPERVCFWGTSSGGNTSLLVALTGDDPKYKTDEYRDFSDSVTVAIDCFGPTNLVALFDMFKDHLEPELVNGLVGGDISEHTGILKEISPMLILEKNKNYPPILLVHGDADTIVPYFESENMYKALIGNGYDAELIRVENAPHEGSFWSCELLDEIMDFIKRKL
ncbi:MAG TPA: alpha/beta hydrolase [Thermoclostridium sp.]